MTQLGAGFAYCRHLVEAHAIEGIARFVVIVVCAYFALYATVFNLAVAWRHVVLRNPSMSYVPIVGSVAGLVGFVASSGFAPSPIEFCFMGASAFEMLLFLAQLVGELFGAVKERSK